MALKLTKADTRVFAGKAGDKVRLDASVAKAADGAPATILAITYNGVTVTKAPFEFTIAKGDVGMVVVYVSVPGTRVSIDEADAADPGSRQSLARQFFDPADPAAVIVIRA